MPELYSNRFGVGIACYPRREDGSWVKTNEVQRCAAQGAVDALARTGHNDMIHAMREHYTMRERAAYGLGILFGWFWRVHHPAAPGMGADHG